LKQPIPAPEAPSQPKRPEAFSASYWIFMAGSLVSRIGDWMDLVALNWAVLTFTNSPFYLALINACRLLPVFVFSVPAGYLADRYDRRMLLILVQAAMMVMTMALATLIMVHGPVWSFALVVAVRSCIATMDPPIRQALIPALAPQGRMAGAIAMSQSQMNLARVIGPSISGGLLTVAPLPLVFWINAASSLAVLASLLVIRPREAVASNKKRAFKAGTREALAYVSGRPVVGALILLSIAPMVFGFPYTSMMAMFARNLFHFNAAQMGGLVTASAVGAVIGSSVLSFGEDFKPSGILLAGSVAAFGASLLVFINSRGFVFAAIALVAVGIAAHAYRTLTRIALQLEVPDELRGRIMSVALMDRGFIPLGAMLISLIAQGCGVWWAGVFMGVGCLVSALLPLCFQRQFAVLYPSKLEEDV